MGHPVILRQQNHMLLDCMHVYVIYLYVHSALYIERNFVISSRGLQHFQTKWRLAVTELTFCSRRYLHSQISRTRLFGGLQMCPLLQNMDFDALFMYHQVKFCVSFSFKCFKEVKIDKWLYLSYSFLTIDCCVRINGEPDRLFSGDIQSYSVYSVIDILIETA